MLIQTLHLKYQKRKILLVSILKKCFKIYFSISPVNYTEIEKLITNLNHNKSLGPSSIPVKIFKNHGNDLKQPLAFLIYLSF